MYGPSVEQCLAPGLADLWVYLMICANTLTNIICYQYCVHYRYRLVSPVNINRHGLYYAIRV